MSSKIGVDHNDDNFNVCAKVDLYGLLWKKPFGSLHSNKWSRKFFVLKDGYLLYYNEQERKVFEKRGYLNIHPKGVLPLGGCTVDGSSFTDAEHHIIYIRSEDFTTSYVCLGADTEFEKERWVASLQEACRVTLKNAKIGEDLIRELENRGLKLSKERQDFFDKLQLETMALRDEIDRNEELEKVRIELDNEKKKLEDLVKKLRKDHSNAKLEYESSIEAAKSIEMEKEELRKTTELLQDTLTQLADEKEKTIAALKCKEEENQSLSLAASDLQNSLFTIEQETKMILNEKKEVEKRFVENDAMSKLLQEEKEIFNARACQLESSLIELSCQKEMTEVELKEEIVARIETERRLHEAENSLMNLEDTIKRQGKAKKVKPNDLCDQVLPHVRNLKRFFERAAAESKIDANMPMIMKNAVLARKSFLQKQQEAKLYERRTEKVKSLGLDVPEANEPFVATLCRTYSTIGKKRSKKMHDITTIRRSLSTRATNRSNGSYEK